MRLFLKALWCGITSIVGFVIIIFCIASSGGFSPQNENKITVFIYFGMLVAPVLSLINIILLWLIYQGAKHQIISRERRFRMAVAWIVSFAEVLVSFPFLVLWFFWPLEVLKL